MGVRSLFSLKPLILLREAFLSISLDRTPKAKTKMNGDRGERKRDTTRAKRRLELPDTFVVGFLSPTRAEWTT